MGILVLGLWTLTASGQPRPGMEAMGSSRTLEDGPGMLLPLVLKGIDLTNEQEKRIHEIVAAHRATFRALFSELQTVHQGLADQLFAAGDVQAADCAPLLQRIAQLREQLTAEGLTLALEVRRVLTPEQLAKAADIKDRMRALHTEMRGLFREKR
jgi:Spy/CpxP family protein refolding chaperone